MDAEMRKEFSKIHECFDGIDEKLDNIENKMENGFSLLLPEEQWPPNEHDLQRAEIRRKL